MADSFQTEIAVERRLERSIFSLMTTSDALLATEARNGDDLAYAELCRRHREMVFRTVLRITRNMDDAEDIVQDSWMRGFTHIGTFDGRSEFSTWVTRIAINSALTMIRRRRTKKEYSLDDPSDPGNCRVKETSEPSRNRKSAARKQKEYGWLGRPSSVCLQSCGQQSKSVKRKTGP